MDILYDYNIHTSSFEMHFHKTFSQANVFYGTSGILTEQLTLLLHLISGLVE